MATDQFFYTIFLIAVVILVLPSVLNSNNKIKLFVKNLSIWAIIILIIIVMIYLLK